MVNVDTSGAIGPKVFIHPKPLNANKARMFSPIAINKIQGQRQQHHRGSEAHDKQNRSIQCRINVSHQKQKEMNSLLSLLSAC